MPNTVTNRQMFFILFMTLTAIASVDIPKVVAQYGGYGGWAAVLLTSLVFAVAALLWAKLNNMHQGKMVFDYSKELVGKAGAYFIAAYFAQYFLTVLITLNLAMSNLLQANFLPNTPMWATAIASIPVIGFVAYKGVTNVARLIEIYGIILLVVSVPVHLLMLAQGDINHILPLYNPAETGKIVSSMWKLIFSFLGVEVIAMIPFTAKNGPKAGKTAFITILLVGLFYVLIVETSMMMIAPYEIIHYNYPLVVAIRQVELPLLKVFQRIDLIYLTVGFIGLFSGLSIVYLNIVEYICRMLPRAKRSLVVTAVGAAAFLGEYLIQGIVDIKKTLQEIVTYSGILAAGLIPVVLIIITKAKKHGNKKAV
jgi:spore germination protein